MAAWTFVIPRVEGVENDHNIHARRADLPPSTRVKGLTALPEIGRVSLSWSIERPQLLWEIHVQRRNTLEGEFAPIATIQRAKDPDSEDYAFVDMTVQSSGAYEYRAELILANGSTRYSDAVSAAVPETPVKLTLRLQSSGSGEPSRIEMISPEAGTAELAIYDVQGTRVRTLATSGVEIGANTVLWDNRNDEGLMVPAGVYFLEARVAAYRDVLKIVRRF